MRKDHKTDRRPGRRLLLLAAGAFLVGGLSLTAPAAEAGRAVSAAPAAELVPAHARPHRPHHWQPPRHGGWRHHHRHHRHHPGPRWSGRHHPGHWRGAPRHRACHPVQLFGYHHGQRALLGGILCYDRHGRAFVLRGTRRVLRYLYD